MNTHQKIEKYIKDWMTKGYEKDIPDECPAELESANLAPSYRKICQALLNNDMNLTSLGYEPKYSIYYSILKKIEIDARKK